MKQFKIWGVLSCIMAFADLFLSYFVESFFEYDFYNLYFAIDETLSLLSWIFLIVAVCKGCELSVFSRVTAFSAIGFALVNFSINTFLRWDRFSDGWSYGDFHDFAELVARSGWYLYLLLFVLFVWSSRMRIFVKILYPFFVVLTVLLGLFYLEIIRELFGSYLVSYSDYDYECHLTSEGYSYYSTISNILFFFEYLFLLLGFATYRRRKPVELS